MIELSLQELRYVNGGETLAIPTEQELEIDARKHGVSGGGMGISVGIIVSGGTAPFNTPLHKKILRGLAGSAVGAVVGYHVFYHLKHASDSHIYQL